MAPCCAGEAQLGRSGSAQGCQPRRRPPPTRRARVLFPAVAAAAALSLGSWVCSPLRLFASPLPLGLASPRVQAGVPPHAGLFAGEASSRYGRSSARASAAARRAAASEAATTGVRVGVLYVAGQGQDLKAAFEQRNVTNETFFQTEVPDSFQMPLAAKLLAMSNTVDVVVAAHGPLGEERSEVLRGYQTVALTTNVPIVPLDVGTGADKVAEAAVTMAEIRQQALFGGGPRKSIFFGIGANKTRSPAKKDKVYF
mmetsp:Transcript_87503/g.271926  ORF Transcript_87503/g.271926 Transcript_87503/m.271926 type:complete len:255 (-) Transcript_87503:44-808(-)